MGKTRKGESRGVWLTQLMEYATLILGCEFEPQIRHRDYLKKERGKLVASAFDLERVSRYKLFFIIRG